jgi:glycosyltransferase involved in cell wall biosynthesis
MTPNASHILISTDAVGGVWRYTQTLALGLVQRGWSVTVLCLGPAPSKSAVAELMRNGIEIRICDLPLDWLATAPEQVHEAGKTIARIAEAVGADSIHLHSPSYAACDSFPVPVVATSHSCLGTWWDSVRAGAPPADFTWRILLHGEGLVRVDQVICPTEAFAARTADYYGLMIPPLAIHNGLMPTSGSLQAHAQPFAFTAGRLWDEAKNIAALEAAAPSTVLPIVAAGDVQGPQGNSVSYRGLRLLGHLDQDRLQRILASRPIYVAPALYEPFGLSILEAARAGCPLVLGDIATLRELWSDAAIFVQPRDPHAIADALNRLYRDDGMRANLGDAARERSSAYHARAFVDATENVHLRVQQPQTRNAVSA